MGIHPKKTFMSTPPDPGTGKKTAFVAVLLIAPLLLITGLELAGRVAVSLLFGVPGKSYGLYRADPVLGHFPAPNSYNQLTSLNDGAFRNTENVIDPRPRGARRVIAYGGSITFCPQLSTEACWPHQLQERLRTGDGNAGHQVLNGGVVQWSLGHVFERARRDLAKFKPDAVILYSGNNESANAGHLDQAGTPIGELVAQGRYGAVATNYPASDWLNINSLFYKVARYVILRTGERIFSNPLIGEPPPLDPATLANYLVVLERVVKFVRSSGAEPIFVIQAGLSDQTGTNYSVVGAKTACAAGARVLDAREAVAAYPGPPSDLFASSIHYSAKGAAVLADYLYDRLYKRDGYSLCGKL